MPKTIEQDKLITNMHNMVVYAQKHGILNDQDILINLTLLIVIMCLII
ncbi:hypothetical protein [Rickettsia asiatica]|nr:hypothetical protein [Rickettsia asiatica]